MREFTFLLLIAVIAGPAADQSGDSATQGWPKLDVYVNLNQRSRLLFMYSATRQEDQHAYADGQTGMYFDLWVLPPLRRDIRRHPDRSRAKLLLLSSGYLCSQPRSNSGTSAEHTWSNEATGRFHLPSSFLLSDRNRLDLRWVNGDFHWRYRNRLKIERAFQVGRFDLTPYVYTEVFRDSDPARWTRARYAAGAE